MPRLRSPLLDLVRLSWARRRGAGSPEVAVGLVAEPSEASVLAAVLSAEPLAVCPLSPVVVRPTGAAGSTPGGLAVALAGLVAEGVRLLLVGTPVTDGTERERRALAEVLDSAEAAGVPVVVPAGSGPAVLTGHRWVIPVASCSVSGRLSWFVEFEDAQRGLLAPGQDVPGPLGPASGNGIAAAWVAGTGALLWGMFPGASGAQVRAALSIGSLHAHRSGPPLLDAQRAVEFLERLAVAPSAWRATG
ncbi:hypothetical protein [Actinokineospora fastidiosa]|uniref:hypothetical protein n=1 Tax=Actinokineospora fastidiosa TaxID=1816 RepID=UPI001670EE8B|nr:hypothetical protein [Actinokineospora fastidiosa]